MMIYMSMVFFATRRFMNFCVAKDQEFQPQLMFTSDFEGTLMLLPPTSIQCFLQTLTPECR